MKTALHHVPIKRHRSPQRGFTLIELMTALAIVCLLAAFALPSYRQVKLKTARAEGRAALMQLMLQQERHYTQYHRYRRFTGNEESPSFRRFSGASARASAYRLEALACPRSNETGADAQACVLLRALPAENTDDTLCGVLTLDSRGVKGAAGAEGNETDKCW